MSSEKKSITIKDFTNLPSKNITNLANYRVDDIVKSNPIQTDIKYLYFDTYLLTNYGFVIQHDKKINKFMISHKIKEERNELLDENDIDFARDYLSLQVKNNPDILEEDFVNVIDSLEDVYQHVEKEFYDIIPNAPNLEEIEKTMTEHYKNTYRRMLEKTSKEIKKLSVENKLISFSIYYPKYIYDYKNESLKNPIERLKNFLVNKNYIMKEQYLPTSEQMLITIKLS